MNAQIEKLEPRCREIQTRLPGFLRGELGAVAMGEAQGHLLTCQLCSEVYGELIMEEVESGTVPLCAAPRIPSPDLYGSYLRVRGGRLGMLWEALGDALKSPDVNVKDWAQEQIEKIGEALRRSLIPFSSPPPAFAHVATRGAVRTRGGVAKESRTDLKADVLSADLEPTGETVDFTIEEQPRVSADGRFQLRLRTQIAGYEGYTVFCSVALPEMPAISFSGRLRSASEGDAWVVEIDEDVMKGVAGEVPLKHVKLALAPVSRVS